MAKVRRVDFYPDELISGVAGKLSPMDFGIYWMVCTLIASRGGPIDNDPEWLSSLFQKRTKTRDVAASIARLIEAEKLHQSGGKLSQKRMQSEVKRASDRIAKYRENGSKGGRPRRENSDLEKPSGFSDENLSATTNHQPPTSKQDNKPPSPVGDCPPPTDQQIAQPDPPPPKRDTARGSRLPDDWWPNPEARRTAHDEGLNDEEIDRCAAKFRDYWCAKPGAGGRKCDWLATWRNWVRREVDDGRVGRRLGGGAVGGGAAGGRGGSPDSSAAAAFARAAQRQSSRRAAGGGAG